MSNITLNRALLDVESETALPAPGRASGRDAEFGAALSRYIAGYRRETAERKTRRRRFDWPVSPVPFRDTATA